MVSVCQNHLLHHQLHLPVEGTNFGGQGLQLFLLIQNHLDQKGLVNGIQLFFGVFDCHSGASFLIGAIIADMPYFRQPEAAFLASLKMK